MNKFKKYGKKLLSLLLCFSFILFFSVSFTPKASAETSALGTYVKVGKTYFIRHHGYAGYLTTPAGTTTFSQPYLSANVQDNRQMWILENAGNGSYFLTSAAFPNYCLDLNSIASDKLDMYPKSANVTTTKWKVVVQASPGTFGGSYQLVSAANEGRRIVAYSKDDLPTAVLQSGSSAHAGWVFEEVLTTAPTRNDAAPPAPHNYTYGSSGYAAYSHAARDVAPTNGLNYPIYADKDGTATYWISEYNGKLSRIGNFVTIRHTDGTGTMYGHMKSFANGFYASTAVSNKTDKTAASYAPRKLGSVAVRRGQIVGYMGETGTATGVHVHVENFSNYDAVWGNSNTSSTWIYNSTYTSYVRDPKNYMKLWWS